jgi:shikimate kinase
MRVFLIGFMGSGKTIIGKKLANKLQMRFVDMDNLIEETYKKTVSEIFLAVGEDSFRKIEHILLKELVSEDGFVLSTGGGVPCYHNNIDLINNNGKSVYLRMTSQALFSRLVNIRTARPLIKDLDDTELLKFIEEKLKEREQYYLKAQITVDALDININKLAEGLMSIEGQD